MSLKGVHGFSEEISFSSHKKSIANEEISVFLQNSHNKTFGFERNWVQKDIKYLVNIL